MLPAKPGAPVIGGISSKAQGHGHVINISCVLGTTVRPAAGAYAATEFALEALLSQNMNGSRRIPHGGHFAPMNF